MIRTSGLMIGLCCAWTFAVPPAPVADPSGVPKNRYISMSVPSNGGEPTALRVTLSSLHHPNPPYNAGAAADFTAFEGEYRWVGPPTMSTESDDNPTSFVAAQLQCTPHYQDWSSLGLFHVYGNAVVPSSIYQIAVLDQSCTSAEEGCVDVSSALQITTARFGDVVASFNPPSTLNQPDLNDGGTMINALRRALGVPTKASTQLYSNVPDPSRAVNIVDAVAHFNAWNGLPYPLSGPTSCEEALAIIDENSAYPAGDQHHLKSRAGSALQVYVTPVPSQGSGTYPAGTQISGQQLAAPTGGFRAIVNVQFKGWDPQNEGPALRGWQVQIDPDSLLGVNASPPAPGIDLKLAEVPCPSGAAGATFCRSEFGEAGTGCQLVDPQQGLRICQALYVNTGSTPGYPRPDWIGSGTAMSGSSTEKSSTGPILFGWRIYANTPEVPIDDGNRHYVATLILDVPSEAAGHVYTLAVRIGDDTMVVAGEEILVDVPIIETIPAVLKFGAPSDATGINRTRFISFVPGHSGAQMAIRVKLASLHHVNPPYNNGPSIPFTSVEGQYRWVGPPTQYVESTSNTTPIFASTLQCTPHYQDWSSAGYLHVTGSAIVPSSQYEVQFVPSSCMGNENACADISAPLVRETTRWGDIVSAFNPPETTAQPDVADIAALVSKFRSAPGAPIKARALLAGIDANGNVDLGPDLNFSHISACVDAFRGKPYPYSGPESCE